MFWRSKIGEQSCHFVERTSPNRLVVSAAAEVIADTFLMIPQQTVKRENIRVRDERHRMIGLIDGLAVRCDLDEESPADLEVSLQKIIERKHVLFFAELHVIGDILQDLRH